MLAVTHIVACLLLVQLMNLDRNEAFIGLLFGVFIDLDHLIGFERYAQAQGITESFDVNSLMAPEGQWKSLFHRPIAVMVVGPLSIASRMAVPILFWGVHIGMDYAQEGFLGNFSEFEAMLLAFMGLTIFAMRYSAYLDGSPEGSIRQFFGKEYRVLRSVFGLSSARAKPST